MKNAKAAGHAEVTVEMLEPLRVFGLQKLTEITISVHDTKFTRQMCKGYLHCSAKLTGNHRVQQIQNYQ